MAERETGSRGLFRASLDDLDLFYNAGSKFKVAREERRAKIGKSKMRTNSFLLNLPNLALPIQRRGEGEEVALEAIWDVIAQLGNPAQAEAVAGL